MKKYLLILFILGVVNTVYAQQTRRTISAKVFDTCRHVGACGSICCAKDFRFCQNGEIRFRKNMELCCTSNVLDSNFGTYFIDTENVVHITWMNGFTERGTVSWDSRGLLSFRIRGQTFMECRC